MITVNGFDYDKNWETRDDMKRYGPFSRYLRKIIYDLIRPLSFTTVLDVGCGQGSFLKGLQEIFPHIRIYGTDISVTALEMARAQVPQGHFQVLDLSKGHLEDVFDLVVCSEVLEHILDDDKAIQNLVRMTGKYLLVSAPQGRQRSFEAKVGHVRNYGYGELAGKLKEAGLTIKEIIEWGFPFYSPLYRNVLDLLGGKGTTGEIGPFRRIISLGIYGLFSLCSLKRGDEIIVLAEPGSKK